MGRHTPRKVPVWRNLQETNHVKTQDNKKTKVTGKLQTPQIRC